MQIRKRVIRMYFFHRIVHPGTFAQNTVASSCRQHGRKVSREWHREEVGRVEKKRNCKRLRPGKNRETDMEARGKRVYNFWVEWNRQLGCTPSTYTLSLGKIHKKLQHVGPISCKVVIGGKGAGLKVHLSALKNAPKKHRGQSPREFDSS